MVPALLLADFKNISHFNVHFSRIYLTIARNALLIIYTALPRIRSPWWLNVFHTEVWVSVVLSSHALYCALQTSRHKTNHSFVFCPQEALGLKYTLWRTVKNDGNELGLPKVAGSVFRGPLPAIDRVKGSEITQESEMQSQTKQLTSLFALKEA